MGKIQQAFKKSHLDRGMCFILLITIFLFEVYYLNKLLKVSFLNFVNERFTKIAVSTMLITYFLHKVIKGRFSLKRTPDEISKKLLNYLKWFVLS